jgi:hypothetical protein
MHIVIEGIVTQLPAEIIAAGLIAGISAFSTWIRKRRARAQKDSEN